MGELFKRECGGLGSLKWLFRVPYGLLASRALAKGSLKWDFQAAYRYQKI